jgi:hypothetical protein
MYLDAILEVAIGLVFSWLVLSIATMQVQEWISSWFRWRAQSLEESIHRMLQDEKLVEQFYNHSMIASLSQPGHKPSYIPSDRFAQTLFDILFIKSAEDKKLPIPSRAIQLEDIKGIGPESANRLKNAGIHTLEELAKHTPEQLRGIIHPRYERIANEEDILRQAKDFLKGKK